MNKFKILVVDDEVEVLKVIKSQFPDQDIVTETSSLKALELLQEEHFDLFIIDFQMPKMDGIELLTEIKRLYSDRQYVSILCTVFGTTHLFKTELVKGLFLYYIEKPFSTDSLKQVVMKAIITLERIHNSENE